MKNFVDICRRYHNETLKPWMKEELIYYYPEVIHDQNLIPFLTKYKEHDLAYLVLLAQLTDKTRYDSWYWHQNMRLIHCDNKTLFTHLPGQYIHFYTGRYIQDFQSRIYTSDEIEDLQYYLGDFFFIHYFRDTEYLTKTHQFMLETDSDLFNDTHHQMLSSDTLLEIKNNIYQFDNYIHNFLPTSTREETEILL